MRWVVAPIPLGSTRIVRRFLLWPKEISEKVRWLEIAYIEQRYLKVEVPDDGYDFSFQRKWVGERWSTREQYEDFRQTHDQFRPPPAGSSEKDFLRPRYDISKLVSLLKGETIDDRA
jgi:hypothetical protein